MLLCSRTARRCRVGRTWKAQDHFAPVKDESGITLLRYNLRHLFPFSRPPLHGPNGGLYDFPLERLLFTKSRTGNHTLCEADRGAAMAKTARRRDADRRISIMDFATNSEISYDSCEPAQPRLRFSMATKSEI